ncbi:MAG TPA: MFS transporter [Xanthobacteraceae bacterium]|nr:MFS transporter [Xanthobacteraceae bacterium]
MSAGDPSQFEVLKHGPFVQFWLSRVLSSLANQMQTVAVSWLIYQMTGSAFDLGLVGLVQFIPLFSLMLVVGHVADRYDRKIVLGVSQVVDGAAMGILALGTLGGWLNRDAILLVVLLFGSARAFQQPTQSSLLPLIVPPGLLSRALAASSSSNQIATIVGPLIGGFLLLVSTALVFATCALLYLVAALLVVRLNPERSVSSREPITLRTLFAGIAFIFHRPIILGAITLDLFAVVLGSVNAMLPIYAKDVFETGPDGLAWLRASMAAGALAFSVVLARRPMRRNAGPIMFTAVAIFGSATVLFGFSTSMPVAMFAMAVMGAADMVSVVIRQTMIQLGTPNEMRGRVSAVNFLFIGTSNQLGDFRSGVMAEWFGVFPSVLIGGLGTLAVVAASIVLFPQLARINNVEDVRKLAEEPV